MGGGTGSGGDNVLTLNNFNRVAELLDVEAATLLESHGLIRHDSWNAPKPDVWKLQVSLGAGVPKHVNGVRSEIEDIISTYNAAHGTGRVYWRYGRKPRTSFECLYFREAAGKSQLTLATRAGLDASLTPCIVIPVKDYH